MPLINRYLREGSCLNGGSIMRYLQLFMRTDTILVKKESPNQLGKLVPPYTRMLSFFKLTDGFNASSTSFSTCEFSVCSPHCSSNSSICSLLFRLASYAPMASITLCRFLMVSFPCKCGNFRSSLIPNPVCCFPTTKR